MQLSFTWPVSTGLPRSCVHVAVTLDLLERVNVLGVTPGCPPSPSSCRFVPDSTARQHFPCRVCSQLATSLSLCDASCDKRFCLRSVSWCRCRRRREDAPASTVDSTFRHHAARSCWSSLWLATLLRHLSERCGQHVIVEDFGLCCFSFGDFSLSVLQVPHVAEHVVPAVGTVEESSELEAFRRSCCHLKLLEHAVA